MSPVIVHGLLPAIIICGYHTIKSSVLDLKPCGHTHSWRQFPCVWITSLPSCPSVPCCVRLVDRQALMVPEPQHAQCVRSSPPLLQHHRGRPGRHQAGHQLARLMLLLHRSRGHHGQRARVSGREAGEETTKHVQLLPGVPCHERYAQRNPRHARLYCTSSCRWVNLAGGGDIDGLVQDCSNSSALAMELLQCCTKPSIYTSHHMKHVHSFTFALFCCSYKTIFYIENLELLWYQLCHHWWNRRLSLWQPLTSSEIKKLASWQLLVFQCSAFMWLTSPIFFRVTSLAQRQDCLSIKKETMEYIN